MVRRAVSLGKRRNARMLKHSSADETADGQGEPGLSLPELFDAEESGLLKYAFRLVGRRAVAEEIVQEVFLQLHARWADVKQPRHWLYRSVRNRAFNHARDNRREVLADQSACLDVVFPEGSGDETPEELILRIEAAGVLRQTIDSLAEQDRQLVELKYFRGHSYKQIAEATGLSVGNVGYRLHHILKQLATRLRDLGMDEES